MPLRLNGSTSGFSQLDAPAIAGDQTFTLPGTGGTIDRLNRAGNILQVVSAAKTNTFSLTSGTFTDVTGLTVSITPTSTSNKILILAMLSCGATNAVNALHPRLTRNGSAIFVSDAAGSRTQAFAHYESAAAATIPIVLSFLDSPSSIASVSYAIQIRANNATVYVNRSENDADSVALARSVSSITVMEVAA